MSYNSPHNAIPNNTEGLMEASGKPPLAKVPKNQNRGPYYPNPLTDIDEPIGS